VSSLSVVVLWNSDRKVAVLGTATGRAFRSVRMAQQAALKYEKEHPSVSTLVCPVEAWAPESEDHPYGLR
jgi:hypothetical protein